LKAAKLESILYGLATFLLFLPFFEYYNTPAISDEFYYAHPSFFYQGLSQWFGLDFGHPPGWAIINWLGYSLFGVHLEVMRFISAGFSLLLCGFLFFYSRSSRVFGLSLLSLGLLSLNTFFHESLFLSYPIIATGFLASLGLVLYNNEKVGWAFLTMAMAIALRESALVLLFGILILNPSKRELSFAGGQAFLFGLYHAFYYFKTGRLLLNTQVGMTLKESAPLGLHFLFSNFKELYLQNASIVILIVFMSSFFFLRKERLSLAFSVMGIIHFVFFTFYQDSAPRDTFMSNLFFICALTSWLKGGELPRSRQVVISLFGIICFVWGHLSQHKHLDFEWKRVQARADMAFKVETYIRQRNLKEVLTATNPDHSFFSDPFYGYVYKHRPTRWFGGIAGHNNLKGSVLLIVPYPELVDNFATQQMIEYAAKEGLAMRSFSHEEFKDVGYWLFFSKEAETTQKEENKRTPYETLNSLIR
jgi:hypothetical protein